MESTNNKFSSRIPNFYQMDVGERLEQITKKVDLTQEEKWVLKKETLTVENADGMIENVVGVFGLPLGLALNFRVNSKDYIIPMAIEETSVVAAASHAAKLLRDGGKITSACKDSLMIGQIQLCDVGDVDKVMAIINENKKKLLDFANEQDPVLLSLGGGAKDMEMHQIDTIEGRMLIVHLIVDVKDAMGANAVNTMAEALSPMIEYMANVTAVCRIISNLSDKRLVRTKIELDTSFLETEHLSGQEVAHRIVKAYAFALADPYRAATHNKGVMNGIDGILIATGNDWRAVEAGAHAYACRNGRYEPLTKYWIGENGKKLYGELEVPMAVGIIGGVTKIHPGVQIVFKILKIESAKELAEVAGAAGLLQNFCAMRTLVTEGIQKGHMGLHARNVAVSAGAFGSLAVMVANQMAREGRIRFDRAKELILHIMKREEGSV